MRPALTLALLAWLPALSRAETYDCSVARERGAFRQVVEDLRREKSRVRELPHTRRFESPLGDSRSCTLAQWCLHHQAVVTLATDPDTPVAALESAPVSLCSGPWMPLCETRGCRHETPRLGRGRRAAAAIFVRGPDGSVRSVDPGTGPGGRPFSAKPWSVADRAAGVDGVSFAWQGTAYTVEFVTRAIFRRGSRKGRKTVEDARATLDREVYDTICAAGPHPCEEAALRGCKALGMSPRGDRNFRDSRGGRYHDDAQGACRPGRR